jgi:hypothetical protein
MNEIRLSNILKIDKPQDYKAHFADYNQEDQPLDVFVRDKKEWKSWSEYRPSNNGFNRQYVFTLMNFYLEKDVWLFGGIYEVIRRNQDRYEIELSKQAEEFIGRLKLKWKPVGRQRRLKFEALYSELVVSEILKEPFTGEVFGGYENIDLSFSRIAEIIKNDKPDWRGALGNVKGVYLITDMKNGKRYVGSAYNGVGIWSRWGHYVQTGHGGNVALKRLVIAKGLEYARRNFKFTLIEYRPMRADDQEVIDRETFWKKALLTRGDFGYNEN